MKVAAAKRPKKQTTKSTSMAVHAHTPDGVHHVVGVSNIRVVIVPDGRMWFAQGLDIDYAAQGKTTAEAKSNFERGLKATIKLHLQLYGTIQNVLKSAPSEIWLDVMRDFVDDSAEFKLFSQVCAHDIHEAMPHASVIKYLLAGQSAHA